MNKKKKIVVLALAVMMLCSCAKSPAASAESAVSEEATSATSDADTAVAVMSDTPVSKTSEAESEAPSSLATVDDIGDLARGVWDADGYTNEFAGLSLPLPKGYSYESDESLASAAGIDARMYSDMNALAAWMMEDGDTHWFYDADVINSSTNAWADIYYYYAPDSTSQKQADEKVELLAEANNESSSEYGFKFTVTDKFTTKVSGTEYAAVRYDFDIEGSENYDCLALYRVEGDWCIYIDLCGGIKHADVTKILDLFNA